MVAPAFAQTATTVPVPALEVDEILSQLAPSVEVVTAPLASSSPAVATTTAVTGTDAGIASTVVGDNTSVLKVQDGTVTNIAGNPNVTADLQTMTAISIQVPIPSPSGSSNSSDAGSSASAVPCSVTAVLSSLNLTRTASFFETLNITIPTGSTLFAPTDEAWEELLTSLGLTLWTSLESDSTLVATLIAGHVVPSVVYMDTMTDGNSYPTVLTDETVSVSRSIVYQTVSPFKGYNIKISGTSSLVPAGQITEGDIENSCGLIDIIDHVLVSQTAAALPAPTETEIQVLTVNVGN